MGLFITVVVLIVILYFVQIGLRRGALPVILALVVTTLAFLVAMDFRLQMAYLLQPYLNLGPQDLQMVSYLILFIVFFCFFGFFAIRYPPQVAPMKRLLDLIAGGAIGVLAGIAVSGTLLLTWFGSTLNAEYPIPDRSVWIKPHNAMLRVFNYVGRRMPGNLEAFDLNAELALMSAKGMAMPRSGDGFWVASIPAGKRVFINSIKGEPPDVFRRKLPEWVRSDWPQGTIKSGTVLQGLMGKTPCLIESDAMSAYIAVETILPPEVAIPKGYESPLVIDGEGGYLYFGDDGKRHFMKLYHLHKTESDSVCKLISLMYLKNASQQAIEAEIPPDEAFNVKNPENVQAALMNDGLSEAVANKIIGLLRRCGKWVYKAPATGEMKVIEMTNPEGDFDHHPVEAIF